MQKLLAAVPWRMNAVEADPEITAITDDSRQVEPGTLFVAVRGVHVDGHRYIPQALERGAIAIVGEEEREHLPLPPDFPYVRVADAREALGWLHAAWHDFPSRKMVIIGVTGTDGKTTTTNLIYTILRTAGVKAGMISTVNARIGERRYDTGLHTTTPPAPQLQRFLAEMAAAGTTHAVLEVTSHGLAQQRVAGIDFDVAVITNLTREHLDYHGTMEAYREAKAALFRGLWSAYRKAQQPKIAVLNADDPLSYPYLREIPADWQVSYGFGGEAAIDVRAEAIELSPDALRFHLRSPWGDGPIRSSLVGRYNVSNILAAASVALALGIDVERVAEGVRRLRAVPGRMERIDEGQPFTAIVDFAHTPNALRQALRAARAMIAPMARVIVVFGSAGERDPGKRRAMGEVAARYADLTVITAEDPRSESLEAIIAAIAEGLLAEGRREGVDFWRVPDRGRAIRKAVTLARPGDLVIVCGKGHEQSMAFGSVEYPWDDRRAMRLALRGGVLDTLPTFAEGGRNG